MNHAIRKLRPQIAAQALYRCGYCQTQERISGVPLTVEHLLPKSLGGTDEEDNLWMSCRLCNEAKGNRIEWLNPVTDDMIPLFNPRTQLWSDHFRWSSDGIFIISLTAIGQATIVALSLNSDLRLKSRTIWVEAGWHPPTE